MHHALKRIARQERARAEIGITGTEVHQPTRIGVLARETKIGREVAKLF